MDNSWDRGQIVEKEFARQLLGRCTGVKAATKAQQIDDHLDYVTDQGTFDVKARKRTSRSDMEEQDEWVWLELRNVAGRDGWLVAPKLDYVAFERLDDFVVVKRETLRKLAIDLCQFNIVDSTCEAKYNLYQRVGRKDVITLIRMDDILALDHRIWDKD